MKIIKYKDINQFEEICRQKYYNGTQFLKNDEILTETERAVKLKNYGWLPKASINEIHLINKQVPLIYFKTWWVKKKRKKK